ncbi:MAG: fructose-1,6-bisphosphatase, partial [Muribaculaceae bacterium]|nr:fructose-1,6-bisphosphatase [Muribaculaceae bacterium]
QIMDMLGTYGSYDIQWGNHDALWMGAAAGNESCIANVLRISLRYDNMATIEEGYGINLVPLATFAMETYGDDPCCRFAPKLDPDDPIPSEKSLKLMAKMHKAISVIQFKLEGQLIDRHPEWNMADRKLLGAIDHEKGTVTVEGQEYPLNDTSFPTVDPSDPYTLTPEEKELIDKLHHSFMISNRLQKHVRCLLANGSLYGIYNSNLLYHASMPLNADGSLKEIKVGEKRLKGRDLYNHTDLLMRAAFNDDTPTEERLQAVDYYWYLWCGPDSILFDKSKMATFERYFIDDKVTHKEHKGDYYRLRDNEEVCDMILDAFGVEGEHRHIINGHVPVKSGSGESPIKGNGKLMVIDGGFSKAYHHTTGIAGYTLVYHSRGFQLVRHEPFSSAEDAVTCATDIVSTTQLVELSRHRMRVRDTDKGKILQGQINELTELLYAYRHGIIKERFR